MEAAAATDESRQALPDAQEEAPKDYEFHYSSSDGKLTIDASADVILPEAEQIPMYHVGCEGFPQELVTAVYDYLFQGEETWYAPDHWYRDKDMIAEEIETVQKQITHLEGDTELAADRKENYMKYFKEHLEDLRSSYELAPEKVQKVPCDSTYRVSTGSSIYGDMEELTLDAWTDSNKRLFVRSESNQYFGDSSISFLSDTGDQYDDDPTANYGYGSDPVPYGTDVPFSCDISYEDAKALAQGLFTAAGVETRLVQTELVRGYRWKENPNGYGDQALIQEETYGAYQFCFSRVVDGVPVAATASNTMYVEDNNPCWLYERMYVTVDSSGIATVYWGFPVTQGEQVQENVQILPFEKAAENFETMAPLIYQGNIAGLEEESSAQWHDHLTVDRVELNLMRIRDGGGLTGLYVPTWVFYGMEERGASDTPGARQEMTPWIILAVNAVDGSIIDVKAGY